MFYAFRLGPIHTRTESADGYFGFDPRRGFCPPVFGRDAATALRALAGHTEPGEELLCERALARAGARLGFRVAPPPEDLVEPRAALAVELALGGLGASVRDPHVLLELARALAGFVRAAPWVHWPSDDPLEVTLSGAVSGRFEGSILGGGGEKFGVVLYPEAGTIARIAALVDQGRMQEASRFDSFAVTLGDEPRFAAEAVKAAVGVPLVPIPMRVRKGQGGAPSEAELVALCAVAAAVTQLSPAARETTAAAGLDALRVEARVRAPAPCAEDAALDAAEVERPRAARNAPCPCGSGKKYKKCHLPLDEAARRPPASALHDRDERLVGVLADHAERRFGARWQAAMRAGYPQAHGDATRLQLLVPWSVYECRVDGRSPLEHYLEKRGAGLSPADRAWLEAQRRAWLSVWEVEDVEPGAGVTARDLLTGERRRVAEASGSRVLGKRDAVLARVVDGDGASVFCGCHSRPLPPLEADRIVSFARRKLRAGSRAVPPARLKEAGAPEMLIGRWEAAVAALARRPLPRLANTDGDPLLWTTDHFALAPGARAEVERRVAALAGVEGPERQRDEARFTVVRSGNPMHPSWENTVTGAIHVTTDGLRLEANSVRRADDLRRAVEEACGALVVHRLRDHTDPAALVRKGPPPPPPKLPIPIEEAGRLVREFKERHYADWVDTPIPALGGLTPRQAMATASKRRKLDVLLKDLEHNEMRAPAAERFDTSALRARLGLAAEE